MLSQASCIEVKSDCFLNLINEHTAMRTCYIKECRARRVRRVRRIRHVYCIRRTRRAPRGHRTRRTPRTPRIPSICRTHRKDRRKHHWWYLPIDLLCTTIVIDGCAVDVKQAKLKALREAERLWIDEALTSPRADQPRTWWPSATMPTCWRPISHVIIWCHTTYHVLVSPRQQAYPAQMSLHFVLWASVTCIAWDLPDALPWHPS